METVIAYTDGGSRGNPGPSGIGVYITDSVGVVLKEVAEYIGVGTNNVAEYEAIRTALETCKKMFGTKTKSMQFDIRLDSELVQKQLTGQYQIKDESLGKIYLAIHNLRVSSFPNVTFTHVRREKNKEADRLANVAMDKAKPT